jgi:two-component system, cell cycle sensor histidine kinase and response regulator CckA
MQFDANAHSARAALDALPVGIVLVDRSGQIRFANTEAGTFLSVAALRTQRIDTGWFERLVARTALGEDGYLRLRRRAAGRWQYADCLARPVRTARPEELLLLAFGRPAEGEPPSERYRDRLLAENIRDHAIVMVDRQGTVTSWSAAAQRILGYAPEDVIGRPIARLYMPDETVAGVPDVGLHAAAQHGRHEEEGWRVRKDGSRVRLHVVTTALQHPTRGVIGFARIIRDLSERTRIEDALRRVEAQFRHAQKLEAVGRLASGIAHDFNNLITAIRGHAQFMLEDLASSHPSRSDAEEIRASADRAAALTHQLLLFSRRQPERPEAVDINAAITSMESLAQRLIRKDISLSLVLAPELWPVHADRGQLEQVIMNLIVNARDAIARSGRIRIATRNIRLSEEDTRGVPQLRPGDYVQFAVADTGAGMDAATRERIFEPFFTTKPEGVGTGLGLATVRDIITQCHGHIAVYSEPGRGALFKVLLPRAADE